MLLYSWLYSTCHNHKRHILKSLFALQMQQSFLKRLPAVSLACGFAYFAVAVVHSGGLWPVDAFHRVTLSCAVIRCRFTVLTKDHFYPLQCSDYKQFSLKARSTADVRCVSVTSPLVSFFSGLHRETKEPWPSASASTTLTSAWSTLTWPRTLKSLSAVIRTSGTFAVASSSASLTPRALHSPSWSTSKTTWEFFTCCRVVYPTALWDAMQMLFCKIKSLKYLIQLHFWCHDRNKS